MDSKIPDEIKELFEPEPRILPDGLTEDQLKEITQQKKTCIRAFALAFEHLHIREQLPELIADSNLGKRGETLVKEIVQAFKKYEVKTTKGKTAEQFITAIVCERLEAIYKSFKGGRLTTNEAKNEIEAIFSKDSVFEKALEDEGFYARPQLGFYQKNINKLTNISKEEISELGGPLKAARIKLAECLGHSKKSEWRTVVNHKEYIINNYESELYRQRHKRFMRHLLQADKKSHDEWSSTLKYLANLEKSLIRNKPQNEDETPLRLENIRKFEEYDISF